MEPGAHFVHRAVPLTLYLIGTLCWAVAVIATVVALNEAGSAEDHEPIALAGVIGTVDHAALGDRSDAAVSDRCRRTQPSAQCPAFCLIQRRDAVS
jgi:hypothetical protein